MSIRKYKPEQIARGKFMLAFAPSTISVTASNKECLSRPSNNGWRKHRFTAYRSTSSMGIGGPLVTTEGITPFHFSTAVL